MRYHFIPFVLVRTTADDGLGTPVPAAGRLRYRQFQVYGYVSGTWRIRARLAVGAPWVDLEAISANGLIVPTNQGPFQAMVVACTVAPSGSDPAPSVVVGGWDPETSGL